jgi:hypothetical protein
VTKNPSLTVWAPIRAVAIGDDIGEVAAAVQHFQEIIQQIEVIQNQLTSTIESQTTELQGEGVGIDL